MQHPWRSCPPCLQRWFSLDSLPDATAFVCVGALGSMSQLQQAGCACFWRTVFCSCLLLCAAKLRVLWMLMVAVLAVVVEHHK